MLSASGIAICWAFAVCLGFHRLRTWLSENRLTDVCLADFCSAFWCLLSLPLCPLDVVWAAVPPPFS